MTCQPSTSRFDQHAVRAPSDRGARNHDDRMHGFALHFVVKSWPNHVKASLISDRNIVRSDTVAVLDARTEFGGVNGDLRELRNGRFHSADEVSC